MMAIQPVQLLSKLGSVERVIAHVGGMVSGDTFMQGFIDDRFAHDFEFWTISCAHVINKAGEVVSFVCNKPQRKVLAILEADRIKGKQGLYNLLKARQWGGSTLTRIYFTWVQLFIIPYAWSAIVADVEQQADTAKKMVETLFESYPSEVAAVRLANMQGKSKSQELVVVKNGITQKRGTITVGSVERPNSLRSKSWRLLHATEVGIWGEGTKKSAESLNQAITAGMPINSKLWLIHMRESTAKGLNYWYKEWMKSEEGKSAYCNIFVGTYEIPEYQSEIDDYNEYLKSVKHLNAEDRDYALSLWDAGATLESIKWWFDTRLALGYENDKMLEEYPNFSMDAFQTSGLRVFPRKSVANVKATCFTPDWVGDIAADAQRGEEAFENITFDANPNGHLKVWSMPDTAIKVRHRYIVVVDIGGRWKGADYSVIRVFDRLGLLDGGMVEAVATWREHLDADLVAWKAAQIAKWYCNALLVVEKNSLKTKDEYNVGDQSLTVLDEIADYYDNLYYTTVSTPDNPKASTIVKYGFHTNVSTRPIIINTLIKLSREGGYIERDERVPYEMERFVTHPSGKMEAMKGEKDDCVISTGTGLYIALEEMEAPEIIVEKPKTYTAKKRPLLDSTFG